jgi:hypothetical protein
MIQKPLFTRRHLKPLNGNPERGLCRINSLRFLLMPVCDWLERRRLGRIPAVLVTAILGFTMLGVMAQLAEYGLATGDKAYLEQMLDSVSSHPDVAYASVFDSKGAVLVERRFAIR